MIEAGGYRVRDIPERLRPREEMERLGVANVSDDVLLAILMRSGIKGASVIDLARNMIIKYGSLTGIAEAGIDELARIRGVGRIKAQVIMAAIETGRRMNQESAPRRMRIRGPGDVASLLRDAARAIEKETFWSLPLDSRNNLKSAPVEVSVGLLDSSLVHAREVFRDAIKSASAAVVLAHNHPSGDPAPSSEDIRITKQLVEAGRIVDIKVLDHIIIGRKNDGGSREFVSLREEGVVKFE